MSAEIPNNAEIRSVESSASAYQSSLSIKQTDNISKNNSVNFTINEASHQLPFSTEPSYNKTLGDLVTVLIDDREGEAGSKILDLLQRYQISADVRRLSVGDYAFCIAPETFGMVLPPFVERKAKKDLLSSLLDGRLQRQIQQTPVYAYDPIKEDFDDLSPKENTFIKSLHDIWKSEDNMMVLCEGTQFEDNRATALLCTMEIPVCFTSNLNETALLIAGLHHRIVNKLSKTLELVSYLNPTSIRNKIKLLKIPILHETECGTGLINLSETKENGDSIRDTYVKMVDMLCGEKGKNVLTEFPTYKSFCDNSNSPIISNLPAKARALLIPENP